MIILDVIAPIASSNHSAILSKLTVTSNCAALDGFSLQKNIASSANFKNLTLRLLEANLLSVIGWRSIFAPCISLDDHWNAFKCKCLNVIYLPTPIINPISCLNSITYSLRRSFKKKAAFMA